VSEVLALAGRHVRSALRSRGPLVLLAAFAAGLAATFLLPTGEGFATATLGALLLVGSVSAAAASASGALLPADRAEGREEWLAPHAPGAPKRRLAAALAGAGLALGASVAAAILAALVPLGGDADASLRASEEVPLPAHRRFRDPALGGRTAPVVVAVGAALADEPGRALEVATRGILRPPSAGGSDAAPDRFEVAWTAGGATGTASVPFRGRLVVPLPPGAREVAFEARTEGMDLRFTEAHVLGGERSRLLTFLGAGLLLGILCASVAPVAVLVSRATSGPTAAGAAAAAILVGLLRGPLDDLALHLESGTLETMALGVLRGAMALAPPTDALGALEGPVSGRALDVASLATALPALAYGLAALVLAAVPLPRALAPARGRAA
jgi:hypothetical protein